MVTTITVFLNGDEENGHYAFHVKIIKIKLNIRVVKCQEVM